MPVRERVERQPDEECRGQPGADRDGHHQSETTDERGDDRDGE
jgi:hypothetical protein